MSFEPGQVRAEPIRDVDVVRYADGTYGVDYRFTVLSNVKVEDILKYQEKIRDMIIGAFKVPKEVFKSPALQEQGETTVNEQGNPYSEELEAVHLDVYGVSYVWELKNMFGAVVERRLLNPVRVVAVEDGGKKYFAVRSKSGAFVEIPGDEIAVKRSVGYSPLAAAAKWFDVEDSITKARQEMLRNAARPEESKPEASWRDRPPLL